QASRIRNPVSTGNGSGIHAREVERTALARLRPSCGLVLGMNAPYTHRAACRGQSQRRGIDIVKIMNTVVHGSGNNRPVALQDKGTVNSQTKQTIGSACRRGGRPLLQVC